MTFGEALRACFDRWATFSGRAPRAEFWWFMLFQNLTAVTILVVGALSLTPTLTIALLYIFFLATTIPSLAVSFRRLQDTGRSGWFSLTPIFGVTVQSFGELIGDGMVVFAGSCMVIGITLILIVWYASEGTRGPNAYGPDPYGRG